MSAEVPRNRPAASLDAPCDDLAETLETSVVFEASELGLGAGQAQRGGVGRAERDALLLRADTDMLTSRFQSQA